MNGEHDDDQETPLDPADRRLLDDLGALLAGDAMPDRLVADCESLLTWADVDRELEQLLESEADDLVGVRGTTDAGTVTWTFSDAVGRAFVELELVAPATGGRASIVGLVVADAAAAVRLEGPRRTAPAPVAISEHGRFTIESVVSGPARLVVVHDDGTPIVTTGWFTIPA